MKALLVLPAAAWIATAANATSAGERAPGVAEKCFVSNDLYAAVRPAIDDAFALVLAEVNANTVDMCLAQNTRARVLLDQAMARREGARGAGVRSHPQFQKRAYSASS